MSVGRIDVDFKYFLYLHNPFTFSNYRSCNILTLSKPHGIHKLETFARARGMLVHSYKAAKRTPSGYASGSFRRSISKTVFRTE